MATRRLVLQHGDRQFSIDVEEEGDDARVAVEEVVRAAHDGPASGHGGTTFEIRREPGGVVRVVPGPIARAWTIAAGGSRWVFADGRVFELTLARPGGGAGRMRGHTGALTAPMPATVKRIDVAVGQQIRSGETLILLEAMKMELPIKAAAAGTVRAINCREGELVQPGVLLLDVDHA